MHSCYKPIQHVCVQWKLAMAAVSMLIFAMTFSNPVSVKADTAYGYLLPESGIRVYETEEILDMTPQLLCYARNEIYARNGRMFRSAELQNYFSAQYWYAALYQPEEFTADMLNTYELQNLNLLLDREAQLGSYTLDCSGYTYDVVYTYLESRYNASYKAIDVETYLYEEEDVDIVFSAEVNLADAYIVDPDSYIFYDSDRRYLDDSDIENLSLQELCYARYEIYARRGRLFTSRELSEYFEQKNWYWGYISGEHFSETVLNDMEEQNVSLLQQREYALDSSGYQLDQPGYSYSGIGAYTDNQFYSNNADQYVIWDSSIRYLTEDEVRELTLQQICYARNEIYARRGYIFKSQELRDYFGGKSWYHPLLTDAEFSATVFNEYEAANVELLRMIEYSENADGYQLY